MLTVKYGDLISILIISYLLRLVVAIYIEHDNSYHHDHAIKKIASNLQICVVHIYVDWKLFFFIYTTIIRL